jgi:hydroxypyruvate isomerase
MDRRSFLTGSLAAGAAAISLAATDKSSPSGQNPPGGGGKQRFHLKYAPHFDQFKHSAGKDKFDQLKFIADQGFTALEENDMMSFPPDEQEKIGREMARLGLTMGVFTVIAGFKEPNFVKNTPEIREILIGQMKAGVETAKRVNARWCTIVPGLYDTKMEWNYQTANVIENLKYCAGVFEPHGLIIVIEPLNVLKNHPGMFLTKIPQAYQICKAVNSPSCKILDDLYHQQITEGNLIPNIDQAWSEIAYFHLGDNPGRNEPTSGEINYKNIFKHLYEKSYKGVLGMEHSSSRGDNKEGEQAVIDAYVECDSFTTKA